MIPRAFKPDFAKTAARFEAWWLGEIIDRAPVTLSVKPERPYRGPIAHHATLRDRWLDVEYQVTTAIAEMERREWLGDSLPVFMPNLGPEITATLFGCDLEFGETTSWSRPVVTGPADWRRLASQPPNFANVYWQTIERMTQLAIEQCAGRYLVGITDLHGAYDMLAGLREPMDLCTDLVDCPELVDAAAHHMARTFAECFRRQSAQLTAGGFGSTTWTPMYHAGPAYVPSCDFWCMVSPATAREMIYPTLITEMQPLERSIFHLDGPQALTHLDLLLTLPKLNAVQWVYGAGQGPAAKWLAIYRRIRAAGKSLQLIAEDAHDALAVVREIGLRGVWVMIVQPFDSSAEAESFLKEIAKL
ncbi:MAG: hypothetical protein PCFJNLEI_03498 [Verrucomicrobiae bacterium]|nr:hypothetical protein [Verrucomicrobiae bacterium]